MTSTWGLHLLMLAGLDLFMTWECSMIQQQHTPQSFHIHQMVRRYTWVQLFLVGYVPVAHNLFAAVGKYYLVDSGYPNRLGYLAPYKGTKYHLQEFRDGPSHNVKKSSSITHTLLLGMLLRGHSGYWKWSGGSCKRSLLIHLRSKPKSFVHVWLFIILWGLVA